MRKREKYGKQERATYGVEIKAPPAREARLRGGDGVSVPERHLERNGDGLPLPGEPLLYIRADGGERPCRPGG